MALLALTGRGVLLACVSDFKQQTKTVELTKRYGTFVFNGLVAPLLCAPPPGVRLPHEPELEETGAVPAASAQSRAGYDVVPTRDERD